VRREAAAGSQVEAFEETWRQLLAKHRASWPPQAKIAQRPGESGIEMKPRFAEAEALIGAIAAARGSSGSSTRRRGGSPLGAGFGQAGQDRAQNSEYHKQHDEADKE